MTPAIDAPAGDGTSTRTGRGVARWRPSRALLGVIVALLASQAVAVGVELAGGGEEPKAWVLAASVALADVSLLGLIVLFASRGADRLTAATLGIRRTRFWPAVGDPPAAAPAHYRLTATPRRWRRPRGGRAARSRR